jgi:DNA-binding transcriptional ArsR family regulator
MAANRNPIDIETLRIDPTDPAYVPRASGAAKTRKKKWERQYILFPWSWLDRLKTTGRGATWRLALFLVYEHWRTGGRTIKLTNIMAAEVGVSPDAKGRAIDDLEQAGLIEVERRPKRSPRISLLAKPPKRP